MRSFLATLRTVVLAGFFLTGCTAAQNEAGEASDPLLLSELSDQMNNLCAEDKFSGVILVMADGEQLFRHACTGAQQNALQITADTRFKLFSTSKHFTAALVMSMIDNNQLSLEDPIARWVDDIPATWRTVTVHDLLVHQSGLPDLTGKLLAAFKDGARDHCAAMQLVLESASDIAPDPSKTWTYNNFGYELLVLIAEQAGQDEFTDLLQLRIFGPANMVDTRLAQADSRTDQLTSLPDDQLAPGYNGAPNALEPTQSLSFVQKGAGGLYSTATDMARYANSLRNYSTLSQATQLKMIHKPVVINDQVSNGIGWFIREHDGRRTLGHSGGNNGYVSQFTYLPDEDIAVIILSNYGFTPLREIQTAILEELFKSP